MKLIFFANIYRTQEFSLRSKFSCTSMSCLTASSQNRFLIVVFSFLGDIIVVDTNVWYHATTVLPGPLSLVITNEYD